MRLSEIGQEERMVGGARRCGVVERLLHQSHAFGHVTGKCVCIAEVCSRYIKQAPRLDKTAQLDGALQGSDGLGDVAPADRDESPAPIGEDETMMMVDLAGDLDGLLGSRRRLGELAKLGEAPGESLSGEDGSKRARTLVAIMESIPLESFYGASQVPDRSSIFSAGLGQQAEREGGRCLERDVFEIGSDGQSSLSHLERAIRITGIPRAMRENRQGPTLSSLVAHRSGDGLGLASVADTASQLTQRHQRPAGVEMEIAGLLCLLTILREVPECLERLLEAGHCLPVG